MPSPGHGQSALDGFDPNANGTILVATVQTDGKILVGGNFTSLAPNGGGAVERHYIARLNPDGTLDTAFNPNAAENVQTIVVQADGKILLAGAFTAINGQLRNHIARLDPTTGLPDSFDPSPNNSVGPITIQTDGKILVGGNFTTIGKQFRNGIARLDPVTGVADSFNPNATAQFASDVRSIVIQTDGKIVAGGNFTHIGGQSRNHIARLDPMTGMADSFDPNADSAVDVIVLQLDRRMLIGGVFTAVGGKTRNRVARLDPSSGLPDSFNPNADSVVLSLALQSDGKILAGGAFSSINGQLRNGIARLDATSGLPDSFNPNAQDGLVWTIAVQVDGKILIGGDFDTIAPNGGSTVSRHRIARLEIDGRADQTLNLDMSGSGVWAMSTQPDGTTLIGGFFSGSGFTINNLGRLRTDGTFDAAFHPEPDNAVYVLSLLEGHILVAGKFMNIGGALRSRIALLDAITGMADPVFNPNANDDIYSAAVQDDGKILVCGDFTSIGGQTRNRLARLDPVTGLADSFDPNPNNPVYAIALQDDGKIVIGGSFTTVGGLARNRIARLDPVTGLSDSFNPNANNNVYTVALQSDGKILVSGVFRGTNCIGGATRNNMARLDPTTGLADAFDPNLDDSASSIVVQADGKIIAGGPFNDILGPPRNHIARFDPISGAVDSFDPNADNLVLSVNVKPDGKLLVGGTYSHIGGQNRFVLARLTNDTSALRYLSVTQTAVYLALNGSSPMFRRVTVESSVDNVNYSLLGNGTRISGNEWILNGLSLSTVDNIYIRVRGYYLGGSRSGSMNVAESIRYGPADPAGPTPTPTPTPTPVCVSNPVVTSNADSGPGSLRQALIDACAGGTITFDMAQVVSPITLSSPIGTDRDLIISGPGPDQLAISGNNKTAVFQTAVRAPAAITMEGLAMIQGVSSQGGILHNGDGTLNFTNCSINNNGSSEVGGGIYNAKSGTINLRTCTVDHNSAPAAGGGIANAGTGTVNVTDTTISNNSSFFAGAGGGIANFTGTVDIANSTITGNSATAFGGSANGGGIINSGGTIRLTNATVTNNLGSNGGGILSSGGQVLVWNTIVALNHGSTGLDVNGAFVTLGHNLIGQNDGSTGFTPGIGNPNGDLVGTTVSPIDPHLGSLANNGGPTMTHLLGPDSLGLGAGDNSAITNPPFSGPPFYDQRGPGFPRIENGTVDIGAVEGSVGTGPTPTPTSSPSPTPIVSPTPTASPIATPTATATPSATPSVTRLGNISTRMQVGTGANVLIGGFIVSGAQEKKVIVRAIGPSLSSVFPNALADPVLELRDSLGNVIMSNDNWRSNQEQEIIASGVPPSNDLESAIVATLPANNLGYTAIVVGANNGTGIGVVEVYDLDQTVNSRLADISTRGLVETGNDVMIAGTIVVGSGMQRVLVRAIGPSLPISGALSDPTLELRDANGMLMRSNDNWRTDQETEIIATSIPPTNDLEAALIETLPGNGAAYTAIVRGTNDGTGVALVEVYALTN